MLYLRRATEGCKGYLPPSNELLGGCGKGAPKEGKKKKSCRTVRLEPTLGFSSAFKTRAIYNKYEKEMCEPRLNGTYTDHWIIPVPDNYTIMIAQDLKWSGKDCKHIVRSYRKLLFWCSHGLTHRDSGWELWKGHQSWWLHHHLPPPLSKLHPVKDGHTMHLLSRH